jgi:hypothetical protein
MIETDRPQMTI